MSTHLIPEKRLDKNGRLVTKHVKPEQNNKALLKGLPAPVLKSDNLAERPLSDLTDDELVQVVGSRLSKAGHSVSYDTLEYIEGTKMHGPRRSLLEAMYEATDGIDARGAKSLMSGIGIYRENTRDRNLACLEIASRAYAFSRKVDDATPVVEDHDELFASYFDIGLFTKNELDSDISDGSDPGDVTDVEGAYLLDRLNISASHFNTVGAYYRSMGAMKQRRDDIVDYLPVLIAARAADPNSNASFSEIMMLLDELKEVCPVDKAPVVAAEIMNRRTFSIGMVEQLAASESAPMIDGVL